MKPGFRTALFISIITLASFLITPGYDAFVSDQKIYVPEILHLVNPGLFQDDFLLSFKQSDYTTSLMSWWHP